jgi:tetratricopeptide (TPR) repeat protein
VPPDLAQLQPQLRAYLMEKIEWVRDAPRQMERHATLGIVYAANLLWREAKGCFENAARLRPTEPLARLYVAISTQELGQPAEALKLYREITFRFPSFPQGFARLGEASLRAGTPDEAEPAFRRLVELAPLEWRGHAGLGEVELRRGNPAAAARHLEQAVQLAPNAGNAHSLLGLAYRGLGRLPEAEFELARGLDTDNYPMPDPWGESARQHMRLIQDQLDVANRYSLSGAHPQALGMLATALSFDPTNLALMNGFAAALNRAGQADKAKAVLDQVLQLDPKNLPAAIASSFAYQSLGLTNEAMAWADKAVAWAPTTAEAHLARANALLAQERDAEALEALSTASWCDPKNPEIHLEIGDVLLRNLSQSDAAFQHYQTACRLRPTLVSAQIRLAQMQIERGELTEAETAVAVVRKLEPNHPALSVLDQRLSRLKSR